MSRNQRIFPAFGVTPRTRRLFRWQIEKRCTTRRDPTGDSERSSRSSAQTRRATHNPGAGASRPTGRPPAECAALLRAAIDRRSAGRRRPRALAVRAGPGDPGRGAGPRPKRPRPRSKNHPGPPSRRLLGGFASSSSTWSTCWATARPFSTAYGKVVRGREGENLSKIGGQQ